MNNNSTITKEDLLSPTQACEILGVCKTTLKDYAKKKLINRVKDRAHLNKVYYLKSQIEEFSNNRFYIEE